MGRAEAEASEPAEPEAEPEELRDSNRRDDRAMGSP